MGKRKTNKSSEANSSSKKPKSTIESFFSPIVSLPKSKASSTKPPDANLDQEQIKIWRMIVDEEKNVFFTGAAGTGKSLLLRVIIKSLRLKYSNSKEMVAVTASTGMAASNIGGTTIHSWGTISPNSKDITTIIKTIRHSKPGLERWKKVKVLIIDEVSMVNGRLFQQMNDIAVALRPPTTRPFGGIQVVVTGDFFQLPPVTKNGQEPVFAFESSAWLDTIEHNMNLKRVFRQKDSAFISALNSIRLAAPTPEAINLFRSLSRSLPNGSIVPTQLYPLREQVKTSNTARLNAISAPTTSYDAFDSCTNPKLLETLLAEKRLDLKVGAQVMLIKNIDELLVNGLVGSVLGFYLPKELVGGAPPLSSSGPPLPSSSSDPALLTQRAANSRFLRHVQLLEDGRTPVVIPIVKDDMKKKGKGKKEVDVEKYPLVLFEYPLQDGGGNGSEAVLVEPDEFKVEDAEGKTLARRVQLPLVLAWAMSIHKSQGQTIHRVKVDLGRVFEKGQMYVALSRASSMDGLQVIGFNPNKIKAHHKVIEWSRKMAEEL